jgi:hypothetical protein
MGSTEGAIVKTHYRAKLMATIESLIDAGRMTDLEGIRVANRLNGSEAEYMDSGLSMDAWVRRGLAVVRKLYAK